MKSIILLFCLSLLGCGAVPNVSAKSWIVKDKSNNACFVLKNKPLFVDQHVTWRSQDITYEIENFDIVAVCNNNFQAAAKELNVNLDSCEVH